MTGPSLETRPGLATDVGDAGRLLECHQIARQLRFQQLVRRYLSQILYGCKSAYCTTPTCLSCNRRLVTKPHRPPTHLTARALAYFLSSQDHPRRGLCPHELKVDPTTLEIEGADGVNIRPEDGGSGQICDVFPRVVTSKPVPRREKAAVDENGDVMKQGDAAMLADAIAKRHQIKKDPKSLGQNLYDTATMIFSYSKHIPTPVSVFASLRAPHVPTQRHVSKISQTEPAATPDGKGSHDSSNVTFTEMPNGHTGPPAVNGNRASPIVPQTSHSENRRPSMSNAERVTLERLSNGHQIHKICHIPELAIKNHFSRESLEPSPLHGTLDGTIDGTETTKHKMRMQAGAMYLPPRSRKGPPLNTLPKQANGKSKVPEHITLPVTSHLTCDVLDQLKEDVYHHRNDQPSDFNFVVDYDTNRNFRPARPFVNRSLFFTLSDPETLLKSFRDGPSKNFANSPLPHLDSYRLTNAFRDWNCRNGALVFDSLCTSVEALFRPPPALDTQKSPRLKPSRKGAALQSSQERPTSDLLQNPAGRYLSDEEVAHIVMICVHALTSLVPNGWPHTWVQVRKFRGWGVVVPSAPSKTDHTDGFAHPWLSIVDELEYEPAVRLASRLLRGIGARLCFEEVLSNLQIQKTADHAGKSAESERLTPGVLANILVRHLEEVERNAIDRRSKMKVSQDTSDDPGWTVTATLVEWLRTLIVKQWDGKSTIRKWTGVGAAFTLLSHFYAKKSTLNLRLHMFHIPYLNERIDTVQSPIDFLDSQDFPNTIHILEFPFLFPQEYLVGYFRTINFTTMFTQFDHSTRTACLQNRLDDLFSERYLRMVRNQLKVSCRDYMVLQVSRENALKETLDQLWGQEKRMLLKPLKVRVGMLEGEVGFDQGGVTCEFFRLVLNEAFKPDNGMFTVDPETRMIWFQPASFEPDWKFQMLGVIFSLAVYNGVTLPVTFPLALYEHLLATDSYSYSRNLTTDAIRDGWPTLAKSFDELLAYNDEVADVYMRDYVFSFEAFGHNVDVDMQAFEGHKRWPARSSPPHLDRFENASAWRASLKRPDLSDTAWIRPLASKSENGDDTETVNEATPVTNANRKNFVKDYLHWLVHRSVERQLSAFATGFHTCLKPRSLALFTPTTLRDLVEGNPIISVPLLRKAARYDWGYSATHPTIVDFWSIIESYSQEDVKRLLEFVTASERVPITGFDSMSFVIERHGGDTDLLPTSSTCFGKLYLPEYKDKEKMGGKLDLALKNCEGFGNA
ncbi:hypothetical protein K458DRAFT_426870 [Lentithecium fluviatile CBS 122367]|uniref:HECT-type E3 ubiquitin transferase n=1 Tax=Lentithecium fluviatile CBS 122367 TaxID=1168545 RepID=A0A6G1JIM7_9PLEO|nr:hypothetical protein K458DRAFT_426870 [Lentithecium fluviatile CBS 122367]